MLHNALCFYVAGSRCHLGTTIFPFQGITCFLFSVLNPNFLLPPQLWISCRMSPARPPQKTGELFWGLSHPLLSGGLSKSPPTNNPCKGKGSTRTQAESTRTGTQGLEVGILLMDRHGGQPESESVQILDTWLQNTLARGV